HLYGGLRRGGVSAGISRSRCVGCGGGGRNGGRPGRRRHTADTVIDGNGGGAGGSPTQSRALAGGDTRGRRAERYDHWLHCDGDLRGQDRKSTRLNSSHV